MVVIFKKTLFIYFCGKVNAESHFPAVSNWDNASFELSFAKRCKPSTLCLTFSVVIDFIFTSLGMYDCIF